MAIRTIVVILFLSASAQAQSLLKDSVVNFFMLSINYNLQMPLGDMQDRFGLNSALGIGIGGKVGKNIFLNVEGGYLFGKNVKENDILDAITDENGFLLGSSGLLADYSFAEKGFSIQGQTGKIISFKRPNANSGLMTLLGAGFLQHKISIDADETEVPMLSKEYRNGYDRLTNGFMLSQFIGYFFVDAKRKRINVYGGIQIQEGFTKNRRSWNYDENRQDDSLRKDILVSLKLGWIIPFYRTQTEKYYFY